MSEISTTEKLILYLFNETALTESVLIQKSIDYDVEVEVEFENIKSAMKVIDNAVMNPSETSIRKIMAYASLPV
jgi:hypothetical protein